jgi:hypothetical protein
MSMADPQPAVPKPIVRWFHLTPGRFVLALLAVEVLLWLSERFGWLGWHKGYAVLTGAAVVSVAMVLMMVWFGVASVFRRRFQFSIRSLLVLVVVVALPCSWLAEEMRAAKRQKAAREVILALGGCVFDEDATDEEGNVQGGAFAGLMRPTPEPGGPVLRLIGRDFVHTATAAFNDKLCILGIVSGIKIVEDGKCWKGGGDLDKLRALKDLPGLRALCLSYMPVDDSDLDYIIPLKQLRQVELTGTEVTDAGVAKLQQALPNCKISR